MDALNIHMEYHTLAPNWMDTPTDDLVVNMLKWHANHSPLESKCQEIFS